MSDQLRNENLNQLATDRGVAAGWLVHCRHRACKNGAGVFLNLFARFDMEPLGMLWCLFGLAPFLQH